MEGGHTDGRSGDATSPRRRADEGIETGYYSSFHTSPRARRTLLAPPLSSKMSGQTAAAHDRRITPDYGPLGLAAARAAVDVERPAESVAHGSGSPGLNEPGASRRRRPGAAQARGDRSCELSQARCLDRLFSSVFSRSSPPSLPSLSFAHPLYSRRVHCRRLQPSHNATAASAGPMPRVASMHLTIGCS